jgi:D-arabinose 1-dehydrogenase-like Zn-dependent alcohol dehydrogenase
MLAIRVNEFGGPDVLRLEEVDMPRPGKHEVLVRVMAAGVGPWDVSLRQGGYAGPLPYIPGGEFAGLVEGDTGSFASFYEGAPVYGYPGLTGCYAQYVTCAVEQLAPIPVTHSPMYLLYSLNSGGCGPNSRRRGWTARTHAPSVPSTVSLGMATARYSTGPKNREAW